uniref:Uncharacterized protein n=1 Tax=Panagrolaimus sp. ES5 TaxID=591445 RepID=A0AC34FNP3_9BILA
MIKSGFIISALFVTITAFALSKNFPKELAQADNATTTILNANGTALLNENVSTPMVKAVESLKRTINESEVKIVEDELSFESSSSFSDEDSFEAIEEDDDEIEILPGFELTEDFFKDVDEDLESEIDPDFLLVFVMDESTMNKNETFEEEEMKESDF